MLEGIFAKVRVPNIGMMTRPHVTFADETKLATDTKLIDLEDVWTHVGLGTITEQKLIDETDWYKHPAPSPPKAKKEGGASELLDAITYENNRLNSVNKMLGGY